MSRPVGVSGQDTMTAIRMAAALYNHVETKQDLLVDILTRNLTDMLAGVDRALADIEGHRHRERLEAFIAFHLTFHTTRRQEALICTTELRSLEPAHYDAVVSLRAAYETRLSDMLRAGAEAGAFSIGDVRIVTMATLAMLTGAAVWYRPHGRLGRKALVAEYSRLVLHGVANN